MAAIDGLQKIAQRVPDALSSPLITQGFLSAVLYFTLRCNLSRDLHLNPKQCIAGDETRCGGDLFHQLINVPPSLLSAQTNASAPARFASSTKMANNSASWLLLTPLRWPASARSTW